MKFELKQHFNIESARFLPHLPKGHPCAKIHGHSFKITVRLQGPLDEKIGWLIDYNDISAALNLILQKIDHQLLNEIPGLENPTSELLAFWFYNEAVKILPQLVQVIVSETPNTEAIYPVL